MDKFLEKWRSDKKYRAKIKLLLYGIFIIFATIYAMSLSNTPKDDDLASPPIETNLSTENKINIPNNYNYEIDIVIDNNKYKYYGSKTLEKTIINKVKDNITTNYIYQNNEYYIKDNDLYVKTTKDDIYDVINYNYLNLETINEYLSKATKNNNQYLVYLKDIILGNDTNDYFVILINDEIINIDYTPLMKQFNNELTKYQVNIKINEIE